jgi:type IX secretion system PorP/SprF family membrane protein
MKKILSGILVLGSVLVNAQQLPQISQYLRNQYMVNPAAAGVYDFTDVTLGGRLQWAALVDAPKTSYLAFSAPLDVLTGKNKVRYNPGLRNSSGVIRNPEVGTGKFKQAVGAQIIADQFGAFRKIGFSGTYAIHLPVTKEYNLSFGTNVGLNNHSFLSDRAVVANVSTDNTYNSYVATNSSVNVLNISAGLYFYSSDLFVGIAADQLTKDMVKFGSGTPNFDPRMHFNFTAGYKLHFGTDLSLTPAVLVKYVKPTSPIYEGSLQFEFKEWIWAAASYRHTDAIVGMIGMNLSNRFKIGYSYDYSISHINTYSKGGHEVVLGIMLR